MKREIEELLESVADGVDVDWEAAAARALSPEHRRVINNLRLVDDIAKATAAFAGEEPEPALLRDAYGLIVLTNPQRPTRWPSWLRRRPLRWKR